MRESRRLLRQAAPKRTRGRGRADAVGKAPPRGPRLSPAEYDFLDAHSAATAAALVGWFVCALFASVAYNWTFYYLLALAAAPRDVLMARLVEARIPRRARAEAQRAIGGCQGMMRRATSRGLETLRHIDSWMSRRDGRRRILVDARTPVNFRIFAPVYRASADRPSSPDLLHGKRRTTPDRPRSTVRRATFPDHAGARGADEVRRLRRIRLHVDGTPARYMPHSDIPRRRREIRLRRAGQVDARMASTVLHQLSSVAQLHRGGRDRCRTALPSGSLACRRSTAS